MFCYAGVQWGRSEPIFGMVLPAKGKPPYVVPGFEEARAWELIRFDKPCA